ncbi:aminodeoxychorismate synthase component I [Aeromonas veronii]|uniref:aminodeoxychorismate synthase component I n=1 Tax=Aeromonas veronii TaxID=654 RepID=UPI000718A671|nr:aminodeoxychorismate synthase component I [Aeromonas veronii]KRV94204.1 aminodeoxychorismate synthase component I [Aeromonas veronii]KRV96531.1 aminodeoxychorismate synthase component I [Aeromonas veronii]KRW05966.1 aminodeoxychorismate synthase component I [Aeromonas veronii]KRW14873.1 aminodeoxychorismate synthase component I [Aeromonas veronii]KRW15256.1 aminodeoxychorismate synthase component I [Aeromonas veronii]
MLLESAGPLGADNGFDIITADPLATLETRGEVTTLRVGVNISEHSEDPLALLAHTQQQLLGELELCATHLPFIGGALGLFGYDLGRRFERLPVQAAADIAVPDMAVGIYDWALLRNVATGDWQLVHWGDEAGLAKRLTWLEHQQTKPAPAFALQGSWQSNMSRAEYGEKFARIQEYLTAGDCYQINLTQRFSAPYQGDEWQAYCLLATANKAPFSAFIRLPDSALLSLSPERFLLLDGRHIETKPIKGTRPRHPDPAIDRQVAQELAQADKDRSENLMIVDLLRNDIGRVSRPGSVSVPHLFAVESFPAVHHLVSTIHGELDARWQGVDLLRACFPGGSITGAPKIRAMEIIEELEPQRRNAYCGSIGYLSQHGRMDTSICIRTLIAEAGHLHCWAGGGIIADSDADSEYQETYDKVARILPPLSAL